MPPLPPRVLGPLSECSTRVRVQGQVTGSTVTIFADGDVVAKAQASGPDEWLPLDSDVRLQPRSRVTAIQEADGETSAASPDPVIVLARPHRLGHVVFRSHPWVGAECVLLIGMLPGADATIRSRGGTFTATADDGTATVHRKPLTQGEVMAAHQTACGVDGPTTRSMAAEPLPLGFSTPRFEEPLNACQTQITLHDVVDGSWVTITRSMGPAQAGCFPIGEGIVNLAAPLQEGEQLSCLMELPRGSPVGQSMPYRVGPRPPEPAVDDHLCAGATTILVHGVARGQRLSVLQDGESLGYCEAPAQSFPVPVPPLRAGGHIRLAYEFCGVSSTTEREWIVAPAPAALPPPRIPQAVFECGETVRVEHVHPGARVLVFSDQLGAPIGETYASSATVDVAVTPLLIAGDRITAVQIGCGHTSRRSAAVEVQRVGDLPAPVVEQPLYEGRHDVTVNGVRPGARVDVYVADLFAGSALADSTSVVVTIQEGHPVLFIGQKVFARERLCDSTRQSNAVSVEPVPPTIHLTAVPTTIDPGGRSTLVWRIDNADRAELDQGIGPVPLDGSREVHPTAPTTYRLTAWHRTVSRSAQVTIEVRMPAPPPPPPSSPPTVSAFAVYNCHVDRRTVNIWLQDLTAGGTWQEFPGVAPQYDASGGCGPSFGATPLNVPLQDGHQYRLVVVDPGQTGCDGRDDPNQGECKRLDNPPVLGSSQGPVVPITVS